MVGTLRFAHPTDRALVDASADFITNFPFVIASEAKQSISRLAEAWIASSLRSSQ
jgi:hypothetical protein